MIWLNMIVPIIALVVMIIFFNRRFIWWEYLLVFAIPLFGIVIAKAISESSQTKDVEQLNYYFTSATYTEYYETYVERTCTRQVACGTDDEGNTKYCDEEYDCSYCDRNPEHWDAMDNGLNSYSISQAKYNELKNLWKNELFVDLHRDINNHWGCGKDGDAYTTRIVNTDLQYIAPITTKYSYENRIQASNNVYNFQKIDTSDIRLYGLYQYRDNDLSYDYNPIYGITNVNASNLLNRWNAKLGNIKRCHMLICIYKNKSNTSATKQESLWKGGNKNEVVLCIGVDNQNKINWTYVFSWTKDELLKIELRDQIKSIDTLDMIKIVNTFGQRVSNVNGYVKRSFKEFNYITVEPTGKAVIITLAITIILTIGLCIFSIVNGIERD